MTSVGHRAGSRRARALAIALGLVACSPAVPGEAIHPHAFGTSDKPELQRIDVRKADGVPSLTLVKRDGDVAGALVVTVQVDDATASLGLSLVVAGRLMKAGVEVSDRRVDRRAFSLAARGGLDGSTPVSLFAKVHDALGAAVSEDEIARAAADPAFADREPTEWADVNDCEERFGGASRSALTRDALESARKSLDASAIAFAAVGTDAFVGEAARAWATSGTYTLVERATARGSWLKERSVRAARASGDAGPTLRLGFFVEDPLRAVNSAEELRGPLGDALRAKLGRLPAPFRIASVNGVSRTTGGCVSVTLSAETRSDDAALADAIATADALVERDVARLIAHDARQDVALERIVRAADPVDAGELAAWWTFAHASAGPGNIAIAAALPRDQDVDRVKKAIAAPPASADVAFDRVDRSELGQGELWVLAANPCAAIEESAHQAGGFALADRARAIDVDGARGVVVEPFLSSEGIGVFAHAPADDGESSDALAARVAEAAARAMFAQAPTRDGVARAARLTADDLDLAWGARAAGVDAFARAFAPDHPTLIEPRGSVDALLRAELARVDASWTSLSAGPVRVVTLANGAKTQGDVVANTFGAWLLPSQARGCAKVDPTAEDRTPKRIDADLDGRAVALLGLRADAPVASVERALIETLAPKTLSKVRISTRLAAGLLIVKLEMAAADLDATMVAFKALLDAVAAAPEADVETARRAVLREGLADLADPRQRLVALFTKRASPSSLNPLQPVDAHAFQTWAKAHAALDEWVIVEAK